MSTVGNWRGPNIVKNGLILYLDASSPNSFYSPTAGTTWKDISGNAHNATLTNGPTFNSANGGSIVFDGTNDSVNLQQSTSIDVNNLTWSCWINATYSAQRCFLFIGNNVGQAIAPYKIFIGTTIQSGQNRLRINYNNVATVNIGNLIDNTLYNLAITYNGTTTEMYVNGASIGTSNAMSGNLNPKTFGYVGSTAQSSEFLSGRIFNTLLYNRALSPTEILQNYNATRARFGI